MHRGQAVNTSLDVQRGGIRKAGEVASTDWVKTLMPVIATVTTLLLGWFVSNRVSDYWDRKKGRRERSLAAMQEIAELFGLFLSVRKDWDTLRRFPVLEGQDEERERTRWQLIGRATTAEGRFEALLVRLSAERRFADDELDATAALRQAFKALRKGLRENKRIPWGSDGAPDYLAFKALAARFAVVLTQPVTGPPPTVQEATGTLRKMTRTIHDDDWAAVAQQQHLLRSDNEPLAPQRVPPSPVPSSTD